ncbi:MAG: hypothetical protein GDA48_23095 [Hormoscilla sp. GM102CHS1]|nr:hypothetical protein [Hormoscilla sp. GM102CHS1]
MNANVINAVLMHQERQNREFYFSSYWSERIDRAIDKLLRNSDSLKPPSHLVRNALSDAGKVIDRRQSICSVVEIRQVDKDNQQQHELESFPDISANSSEELLAIKSWLERARLLEKDRTILSILLKGGEAEDVAQRFNSTVKQARVRISRTRKRAWKLYQEDTHV